jgi:hypothetical protein
MQFQYMMLLQAGSTCKVLDDFPPFATAISIASVIVKANQD